MIKSEADEYERNLQEVNQFIKKLKMENKSSIHTLDAYYKDLEMFFAFLSGKSISDIDERDILEYIKFMRKEYTQNTTYRKLLSIKKFFKYLFNNNKIDKLITENLKTNNQQNHLPEILSEEEIFNIMENCDKDKKGKRDLVIIKLLYETGILISSILQLKISDVNNYKYINYESSNKSCVMTIGAELSEVIKEFINTVWLCDYKNENEFLFPGLSRQNFAARLKKYAMNAGITRNVSPNMFRNTLAVNLLENGRNIKEIKDSLNYVNISRTGIYNIRNKSDIKEIYDKISIGDWNVSEDF